MVICISTGIEQQVRNFCAGLRQAEERKKAGKVEEFRAMV